LFAPSTTNRESVTVIEAISAGGVVIPLLAIVPGNVNQ
jgi:hypothetical protein